MHYGAIKNCDIANGDGCRVSLFVSGCRNRCEGCFQKETWDFDYGEEFTEETENHIIELLSPWYISGLSVLGGDPMEIENQKVLLPFLKRVKDTYPQKSIWMWTGYRYESVENFEILKYVDVLVDGRYVEAWKDISLRFKGSRNQKIIDVKNRKVIG